MGLRGIKRRIVPGTENMTTAQCARLNAVTKSAASTGRTSETEAAWVSSTDTGRDPPMASGPPPLTWQALTHTAHSSACWTSQRIDANDKCACFHLARGPGRPPGPAWPGPAACKHIGRIAWPEKSTRMYKGSRCWLLVASPPIPALLCSKITCRHVPGRDPEPTTFNVTPTRESYFDEGPAHRPVGELRAA